MAPATRYDALAAELGERDAAGFVCVGDRFDDDLSYLTRFSGPDRGYAFVFVAGDAVLCAPALFEEQAREEFPGDVVYGPGDLDATTPGEQAAEVLESYGAAGTVLAPQSIPHDAALYLERAGFDVASTDVVARMREHKTPAEVDAIRAVQGAAEAGMRRAETVLARADVDDGTNRLVHDGTPLSTHGLRREIDAVLAREGVTDAGNTVVASGGACADLHFRGDVPVHAGETVLIDISPRGPHGYYGDLTRTFVRETEAGWDRRAYLATQNAQDVAFDELGPGVPASTVHTEAAAEVGAYGFDVGYDVDAGFTHGTGHGVGVSLHEAPSLTGDGPLEPGHVVTVEPGVYDPERGGVRIEDLVVVTEDGFENLTDYPRSITPRERE